MSRSSARTSGSARIAVVGAATDGGLHLREALARRGVPGERVDLYGTQHGEAVISEYDGEARLVQAPDVEEIAGHDVIFLCEGEPLPERLDAAVRPETAVIDLSGGFEARETEPGRGAAAWVAVPHPLALLLADVLEPIERAFGIAEALAVVLRPASDLGQPGVEELREQTVRLLSFAKVPTDTFGRQLAFNVIPQREIEETTRDLELRVVREVGELLGWSERRIGVRLLMVPLFYGHGATVRLKLAGSAGADDVRSTLAAAGWIADDETPLTPLDVTGEQRASVADLEGDGLGGFWLWIVAGENAARGAERAIRLAEQMADL